MKGCLEATQAKLVELETKILKLKEQLEIAEDDLKLTATKDDLTATKEDLASSVIDLISKDHDLERDVSIIRNPPFIHSCGYIGSTSITSQTITYSSLLYSSTDTEGGGLDIATGVFTCPWPGSYTVTWSLLADDADSFVRIYLRLNGKNIDESRHVSWYDGPSGK